MWFEKLVGFKEENPTQVRQYLTAKNGVISSSINGKSYCYGKLQIASLETLRQTAPAINKYNNKLTISEIVADVQTLHQDPQYAQALFQAASQFNLLEMVAPHITPEQGVARYENDLTQGPACAIACGAGTIYRNYFVTIDKHTGQTADKQIDCLADFAKALPLTETPLWEMKNGYALANLAGLQFIKNYINSLNAANYEALKGTLRIGLQWNTEVTISPQKQLVSQAYCSALPVAYSFIDGHYWETFARLILSASYEATFYAALQNYENTGNNTLFLTLVGGGAFGNEYAWIFDAITHSLNKFKHTPLDVKIVSYGTSNPEVKTFIQKQKA